MGLKIQNLKKVGSLELKKGLKWWVSSEKNGLKKKGLEGVTYPYYLRQCEFPLPHLHTVIALSVFG